MIGKDGYIYAADVRTKGDKVTRVKMPGAFESEEVDNARLKPFAWPKGTELECSPSQGTSTPGQYPHKKVVVDSYFGLNDSLMKYEGGGSNYYALSNCRQYSDEVAKVLKAKEEEKRKEEDEKKKMNEKIRAEIEADDWTLSKNYTKFAVAKKMVPKRSPGALAHGDVLAGARDWLAGTDWREKVTVKKCHAYGKTWDLRYMSDTKEITKRVTGVTCAFQIVGDEANCVIRFDGCEQGFLGLNSRGRPTFAKGCLYKPYGFHASERIPCKKAK